MKILKYLGKIKTIIISTALIAAIVLAITLAVPKINSEKDNTPDIISTSTLEKILNVSELSTCTAVYNGIAKVNNPDNPEEISYYVAYDAKVKAGIDFDKLKVEINDISGSEGKSKTVKITIPKICITDINVDISSLDFMFINKSANTSSVTEEAYKACNDDVKKESESQQAIYDLAKQNSQGVVKALVEPLLTQLNEEQQEIHYNLTISVEE